MTTDASDAWKLWHEHRVEAVSEPMGRSPSSAPTGWTTIRTAGSLASPAPGLSRTTAWC